MPSRLVTAAILAFWLAMTGWLIQREVVPLMLADMSPSFQPDLTDEIGSPMVAWTVLNHGKRIGSATSKIVANDDRTFEFRSNFHFDHSFIELFQQIDSVYRVTDDGRLLGVNTKLKMPIGDLEVRGDVIDSTIEPKILLNGEPLPGFDFGKFEVNRQGNVVNPMHLMNRLRGLRDGQTWRIPLFDPTQGIKDRFLSPLIKQVAISAVIAEVKTDNLPWDRKEVACYKIEYHEAGKEVTARTWVRRSDGLVLRQESTMGGFELVIQRVPN